MAGNNTIAPSPKTHRGQNKPKCIQCGNVARSRCPYQSCKSCCFKAQNPCHIHVLKANATVPEKPPTSGSLAPDQQPSKSNETPSSGSSLRVASLRQLSSNFAQFNNIHISLRSKKPLTRKDAEAINEWRFSRLKESKERNIEAENEAFDRYMQNISLLEDSFSVKSSSDGPTEDASSLKKLNTASVENDIGKMTAALKLNFRSNVVRTENYKKRIQKCVCEGLNELKTEATNIMEDKFDKEETSGGLKKAKLWQLKSSEICDLNDKLSKARNAEDLKSCMELKLKIFDQHRSSTKKETSDMELFMDQVANDELLKKEFCLLTQPLKTAEIDQETLTTIDSHFSSLEQIEDL